MEIQSLVSTGPAKKIVAILAFHKIGKFPVGGWDTWNYIPESTFGSQLSYLRENGWQVIDLATFLRGLAQADNLPERAALLTFHDGYRSMLKLKLPWLQRFGYPAVLFVPTDFIGRRNTFDTGIEPEEAICDWDELQQYGDIEVTPQATSQMLQHSGYRAAWLYGGGLNSLPMADQYRLSRPAMGPDTDLHKELG